MDIGSVSLTGRTAEIEDTVVTGSVPDIRQYRGNIIIGVENTSLALLPTAEQILFRSPGVTVSNGTVTVLGRGKPLVYIDDIEMRSFTEIRMLNPGDIVSIEVDYNPSSRYKADVRSLIRIRTKRKRKNHTALRLFDNAAFTK